MQGEERGGRRRSGGGLAFSICLVGGGIEKKREGEGKNRAPFAAEESRRGEEGEGLSLVRSELSGKRGSLFSISATGRAGRLGGAEEK